MTQQFTIVRVLTNANEIIVEVNAPSATQALEKYWRTLTLFERCHTVSIEIEDEEEPQ